jgi:hypothetical protein
MLVIVHHRDIELFFQATFYFEALRCFDIFQVDTTEGRSNGLYSFDEFFGIFFVYFNIEYVDAGINLNRSPLPSITGLPLNAPMSPRTEYSSTVGDYSNQVSFRCIFISILRILFYFEARLRHTGRVSKRKIGLGTVGLGRHYFYLTWFAL